MKKIWDSYRSSFILLGCMILGGIVAVNPGTGTPIDAIANGLTYALQYLAMCILLVLSLVKSGAWARDIVSGF